jgi:hypothetical protein
VLSEPGSGSLPTGIAPAANRTKWIIGAPLASVALVAVGFFLSRGLGGGHQTPHSAAAGSNAADPSAIPSERRVPMVELSAATSPPPPPPPPPQPSAAPEPPATSAAANNPSRAVRGRRGPLPHTASKAEPSASANTAPAAPAAAPASATPAPTNNSWDRSTFGGRY